MPADETERSYADEIFSSAFGDGDSPNLGGVRITTGPLAQQNPYEDPVTAQRRARAEYHRGLAFHGLRENEDGNVVEKDAAVQSTADVTPESLVAISEEEPKEASYQPAGMLTDQEGERPPSDLRDAEKPPVSDFPAEAKRKTQSALMKKLRDKKPKTEVAAKKTETPPDVGQPGDEYSPGRRAVPDQNPSWSPAATGATDKLAEDEDEAEDDGDPKLTAEDIAAMRAEAGIDSPVAHHLEVAERVLRHEVKVEKLAEDPNDAFVLDLVGLPVSDVGSWLRELSTQAALKIGSASDWENAEQAVAGIDWDDPNPFLLATALDLIVGEDWVGFEPETLKVELERAIGREVKLDRILAVKLIIRRPELFLDNVRAAEKITVALNDTEISPGDLEDLPPEWIATAFAVHKMLNPEQPAMSEKVRNFFGAYLIEYGMGLAPTNLMQLDPVLRAHVGESDIRQATLDAYIEALVDGPIDAENAVVIGVNRMLACHVAPLGVLAEI